MELQPYIFFYGRCREALEFYKGALGGTYEAMRNADTPMAAQMPAEAQNNIMHARFTAPGIGFLASDGMSQKAIDTDAGNISLAIETSDAAEGERVFQALSQGGSVSMPLADAFWGGRFGVLTDRFGIEWMVNISHKD